VYPQSVGGELLGVYCPSGLEWLWGMLIGLNASGLLYTGALTQAPILITLSENISITSLKYYLFATFFNILEMILGWFVSII
jgi:hypothetical protein